MPLPLPKVLLVLTFHAHLMSGLSLNDRESRLTSGKGIPFQLVKAFFIIGHPRPLHLGPRHGQDNHTDPVSNANSDVSRKNPHLTAAKYDQTGPGSEGRGDNGKTLTQAKR